MTVTRALWCKRTPCRLLLVLSPAPWMHLLFPVVRMKILHNTADCLAHISFLTFLRFVAGQALWKCLSRRRWWERSSPTCLQSSADILSAGNSVLKETSRFWEQMFTSHVTPQCQFAGALFLQKQDFCGRHYWKVKCVLSCQRNFFFFYLIFEITNQVIFHKAQQSLK